MHLIIYFWVFCSFFIFMPCTFTYREYQRILKRIITIKIVFYSMFVPLELMNNCFSVKKCMWIVSIDPNCCFLTYRGCIPVDQKTHLLQYEVWNYGNLIGILIGKIFAHMVYPLLPLWSFLKFGQKEFHHSPLIACWWTHCLYKKCIVESNMIVIRRY